MTIFPLRTSGVGLPRFVELDNWARGLRLDAMITSSPALTYTGRWDKRVWVSCTFTGTDPRSVTFGMTNNDGRQSEAPR